MTFELYNCGSKSSGAPLRDLAVYKAYPSLVKVTDDTWHSEPLQVWCASDLASEGYLARKGTNSYECVLDVSKWVRRQTNYIASHSHYTVIAAHVYYKGSEPSAETQFFLVVYGDEGDPAFDTCPPLLYSMCKPPYLTKLVYVPPSWVFGDEQEKLEAARYYSPGEPFVWYSDSDYLFWPLMSFWEIGEYSLKKRNEAYPTRPLTCFWLCPNQPYYSKPFYITHIVDVPELDMVPRAYIRWQTRFGFTNIISFEIHDFQQITDDTLEIQSLPLRTYDPGYDVRKNYHYQGTIYRRGCTAYDIWLFSDIVTSQKVEILFLDAPDGREYTSIKIKTDKITIPTSDAKGPYELKIDFEFNKVQGNI